jgi:hypothetical protein
MRGAELSAGLGALMRAQWGSVLRLLVSILIAAGAGTLAPVDAWALTSTSTAVTGGSSVVGQSVTFTATVTPGGAGTPTGTVTFFFGDGSAPVTQTLNGSGQATATHAYAVIGAYNLTASYNGDSSFAPSSGSNTQTVTQASTNTALASSQSPSVFGQAVTFTATVTPAAPGAGSPTGSVTFNFGDGSAPFTQTVNGSGQAVAPAHTYATVGTFTASATYSGDTNFITSNGLFTQSINQAATTVTVVTSQSPSGVGQPLSFTATVTAVAPGAGSPTGNVTFNFGDGNLFTSTVNGSGQASATHTYATAGTFTVSATYSGDTNFSGNSGLTTQSLTTATSTTLTSSQNPSNIGQAVTFTATATSNSGTPTGSITFKDGGTTIGTVALAGGSAAFTTSALTAGNHPITAVYGGGGIFAASTSAVLTQTVAVPADSTKLRSLQVLVTKLEAQGSAAAITGAVDDAIGEAFSGNGQLITPSDNGLHFNFAAEPPPEKTPAARVGDAFAALDYASTYKAPPRPVTPPSQWLAWADARGTGWNTGLSAGDIRGGQVNALAGLTRKITPDALIGVFGGYENFSYDSQLLNGTLKGEGWTAGGYLAWRLLPGLRLDVTGARSGVDYNGVAGMAVGTFTGARWIASTGLTGDYKAQVFEIEPSARVYGLWEHEPTYIDSLGTPQAARNFSSGRASAGTKVTYPWMYSATMTVAPYVGAYADYYFSSDDAGAILLPTQFIQGWSARAVSGVSLTFVGGARLSIGGEAGGLGSGQFVVWTLRGRASVPF